ncbi:hypothetical protein BDV34DRAFT_223295 [Aspergillus parasiticus]|uniref:Uncharacterized protein n=1 Tax=Aspergillus parasiticus TaxID=5067 RepID=A0A5N6DRE8_ASPPA|nr:hypothetical protein BDV34DRAFT_223295 [Aspergillus parasiticus]
MADSRDCTLLKLYNTGKPLFTRRVLEDLSRQIDEGKEEVYIPNLDGVPRVYNLKPPYCENYQFDTYFICYRSIQSLCHIYPYSPESFLRGALTPVSIGWVGNLRPSGTTFETIHGAFVRQRQIWLESDSH